jgi:hypothetical protein
MEHNDNFQKCPTNNIFLVMPVIGIVLPLVKRWSKGINKNTKQ